LQLKNTKPCRHVGSSQPRRGSEQNDDDDSPEQTDATLKEPTSSSTRPPPPHPILKKSRGPSTSGPRPTARFVSPPDSGDEGSKDEDASSGSTAVTGVDARTPPTQSTTTKPEKRSTPVGKKFIASTSASKRRPLLPRRPSSQSSTNSEAASREGGSASSSSRYLSSQRGSITTLAEHPLRASNGSSGSSVLAERQSMSAKAAGKKPAKGISEKKPSRSGSFPADTQKRPSVARQQQQAFSTTPARSNSDTGGDGGSSFEVRRPRIDMIRSSSSTSYADRTSERVPVSPIKSTSYNVDKIRPREMSIGRAPPHGLLASSVAATSNIAVQGQFDFEAPAPGIATSAPRDIPDVALPSRPSSSSLFAPTQPSPTPPVPLARSKSQLTLLLEREKERHR
jgi:hypothetical protein